MTRLRVLQQAPESLGITVIAPHSMLPAVDIVVVDVGVGSLPAAEVIGNVSHRIAVGAAPAEIIFASTDPECLEPYRGYIS